MQWARVHHASLLLSVILLAALGLRLWGFGYDQLEKRMPYSHDSLGKLGEAQAIAAGRYVPRHYKQPDYLIYTTGYMIRALSKAGFTSELSHWNLATFHMILCAVATVLIIYLATKLVFKDTPTALLAALFLSVIPANVIGSRYIKEDIPMMMLLAAAIYFLLRLCANRRWYDYVLSGLFIGIAASAKYAALGLIPFYVLAHAYVVIVTPRGKRLDQAFHSFFFIGLAAFLVGAVAFNPYITPSRFPRLGGITLIGSLPLIGKPLALRGLVHTILGACILLNVFLPLNTNPEIRRRRMLSPSFITPILLFLITVIIRQTEPMFYAAVGLFLAAHLYPMVIPSPRPLPRRIQWGPVVVGLLVLVVLAGLLFHPYGLLDPGGPHQWGQFHHDFAKQAHYAKSGHNDGTSISGGDYGWTFYLRHALVPGMGIPLVVAALAGMVLAVCKKQRLAILLIPWIVISYLGVESSLAKPFPFFTRYLHGLFPFLCLMSAFALRSIAPPESSRTRRAVFIGAVLICLLPPLIRTSLINASLQKDTRKIAAEWINENLEPDATLFLYDAYYSPRPDSTKFTVKFKKRIYSDSEDNLRRKGPDYLILNSFRYGRYTYSHLFSDQARHIYDYYQHLMKTCTLVTEIRPQYTCQTYGFHNPIIRVYRTPWATTATDEE